MNSDQSISVAIAGSPLLSETSCDQEVASFRISDLDWTSFFLTTQIRRHTCNKPRDIGHVQLSTCRLPCDASSPLYLSILLSPSIDCTSRHFCCFFSTRGFLSALNFLLKKKNFFQRFNPAYMICLFLYASMYILQL